jgi:hypothetical protein
VIRSSLRDPPHGGLRTAPALRATSLLLAAWTLLAAAILLAGPAAATAAPRTPDLRSTGGPVVLLGTAGLHWDDVGSSTPALVAALRQDAAGSLAVRSVRDGTCLVDGWLAVSAGRRAADVAAPPVAARDLSGCRIPIAAQAQVPGGPATAPGWDGYRAQAAADLFDADPGLLGSTLEAAGISRAAVGPGALIATADRQGHTPRAWPGIPVGPGGTIDPDRDAAGLAAQVKAAVASGARFVAVDVGAIRDPDGTTRVDGSGSAGSIAPAAPAGSVGPAAPAGSVGRGEQVTALDTRLRLVRDALPAEATVIIASLADDGGRPRLQVILASGPTRTGDAFGPGLLRASSTLQDGLVQSTDLLPTVVAAVGMPVPVAASGAPLGRVPGGDELDRLRRGLDLDEASFAIDRLIRPFFVAYSIAGILALAGLALVVIRSRRRPRIRRRALVGLRTVAVAFSLVPAATFVANLWPWWRASAAGPVFTVVVLGLVILAVVAFAAARLLAGLTSTGPTSTGPGRRSLLGNAGMAGALTALVLVVDLAVGSPLELVGLIGGHPVIAGRFHGLSNPTFALFATGALFGALALAELMLARGRSPRQAALAVTAVGAAATVIDVAPNLGCDFGGPPALVPAFGLLALWVAGIRVTWRRLTAIAGLTVGVLVSVVVLDWLRPAERRTHLGRFLQSVLDGEGGPIVQRKAEQNLGLLLSSPLTMAIPAAAVLATALLWHPARWRFTALQLAYDRQPLLPAGLAALGILLLLGFLANDTGTSIPPGGLMILAPLLVEISARAVERDDAEPRKQNPGTAE